MGGLIEALKNRAKGGPIKWPALNITLFSGLTLSIGAILTAWHEAFNSVFGYKPQDHPGPAAAIFVGLVISIGLIVAADLLTRGIASSNPGDSAKISDGWKATLVTATADEADYSAAAMRIGPGGPEVLIVKSDKGSSWRALGTSVGDVRLTAPS